MKGKSYKKQLLAAVIAFVVCLCLCTYLFGIFAKSQEEARRNSVQYLAETQMTRLSMTLQEYEQIPQVWSGIVRAEGGEVDHFEEISRQLYEKNPTINAIQLSPDGIVTYTYPKNIDIIGHNLLEDDVNKDEAQEAVDTGEFVISGPVELVQGGTGLIIRYPIYLDGEFWGFSTVVLNVPDVFEDVGLDSLGDEGYAWTLTKEDNGETEWIRGDEQAPADAVSSSVTVGRRTWTLSMAPARGWSDGAQESVRRWVSWLISLMAAVGAFLIMMLIMRNRELEQTRSDLTIQTKALAASKKANRMQTRALEASKKANEMQAEALEASRQANQAQMQALEMAKRENVKQAAALQESEASNRAKTEFISRISHDIRTPIGAIQNLTEFAMQDIDDPEKLRSDLEKIESSNQFLLSLINDVLDISRVDSGKIELTPEPYPFDEFITNIRNIMDPMCAEKGIGFEMTSDGGKRGVIVADKIRVNQIVLNIFSNAVKYTPEGGHITYISHSRQLEGGQALFAFTVKDTGIGMSKEFQQRMFDEFSQEYDNPGRASGITGTGLGLAIVKRMVDLMDGEISVRSDVGKGTAFTVRIVFPDALANPEYVQSLETHGEESPERLKFKGHILVAEDNEINQAIAVRIFEECGLKVDLACDGCEALERFSSQPEGTYDAIFMDIQMPNMNGYEATRAIRALAGEEARTIPIIAMTADAFEEAMRKAEEAGMNEYVTKPLNVDYIMQILSKIGLKE